MSETRLELQIVENSKSAIAALDNLANALGRVSSAVSHGFANVSTKNIQRFGQAISNAVTQTTVRNYERLAQALESVSKAASKVPNLQSLQNTLGKVNDATSVLSPKKDERTHQGFGIEVERQIKDIAPAAKEAASANHTLRDRFRELFATTSGAKRNMGGLLSSFARIAKYRFLRAVLKEITEGFKFGFENMYQYAKYVGHSFAPAVDSAKDALFKMKNSIGAALAPAIQMLIPYLVQAVNWFINLLNIVNQFLSLLRGQSTWTRATNASASTLDKVKDSAKGASASVKELKGLLADWDELNIIQQETGGGGGGGSGSKTDEDNSKYGLLFEEVSSFDDNVKNAFEKIKPVINWIKDNLDVIKEVVLAIGAGFLAWKLSNAFANGLFTTIRRVLGMAIAFYGAVEAWKAFKDQWENGVNIENMQELFKGLGLVALGLFTAFGWVGLAIGFIVDGAVMAINPLKELIETGKMTDESLGQLSTGLVLIGAGISFLTGSWIPLLGVAVAVAVAWIVQKWDDIKQAFIDAWDGVINWWNINIQPWFDAALTYLNDTFIQPICDYFSDMWTSLMGEDGNRTPLGEWWDDVWGGITSSVEGINNNIVQPIIGFFTALWGSITGDEENNIETWWNKLWNETIPSTVNDIDKNIVQPIVGFFESLWGSIQGNEENNLGTWWTNFWENTIGGMTTWIETNITSKISGLFMALWEQFGDSEPVQNAISWFNGLWTGATGFAKSVGDIPKDITEKIGGFFTDLWSSFSEQPEVRLAIDWWNGLWTKGKGFAENVPAIATSITELIKSYFSDLWNSFTESELVTTALSWWNGLWGPDGTIANGATDFENNVVLPIAGYLENLWNNFNESDAVKTAISWWNGLWGEEGTIVQAISNISTNILTPVETFFSDLWGKFTETDAYKNAKAWWESIWAEDGAIGSVVKGADKTVEYIGDFFGRVWASFSETESGKAAIEWWNGIWGEGGTIATAVSAIETNVLTPVSEFFTSLWGLFTESDTYNSAKSFWDGLWGEGGAFSYVPEAFEGTIGVITGFFSSLWSTIKGDEENDILSWWNGLWGEDGFQGVVNTIGKNVTEPIENYFSTLGANIISSMTSAIADIKKAWQGIATWFYNNVSVKIANFFIAAMNGVINAINVVIDALNSLNVTIPGIPGLYDDTRIGFNIGRIGLIEELQEIQEEIDESAPDIEYELDIDEASFATELPAPNTEQFVSGIQGAEEDFTQAVSGILDAASSLDGMSFSFTYEGTGYGAWNGRAPRIPKRANGGFVTTGDMFIANEAGPELVGTIGGRTAVANEGQIVAGISSGVAAASRGQERLLVNIIDRLERIEQKEFTAKAVPSSGWGKFNRISNEMYARNTGR